MTRAACICDAYDHLNCDVAGKDCVMSETTVVALISYQHGDGKTRQHEVRVDGRGYITTREVVAGTMAPVLGHPSVDEYLESVKAHGWSIQRTP